MKKLGSWKSKAVAPALPSVEKWTFAHLFYDVRINQDLRNLFRCSGLLTFEIKMFVGNPKIENAVKIINSIEDGKFPLLLNRIAQFLTNGSSGRPFTSLEETKLETSLEITKPEIETLIDGIIEIFNVSAYLMLKPSLLGEELEKGLQLSAKKAEIFVQVWAASAKGIVDNLKQKTFFPQLSHISYSISVETASESTAREKCPKAQLQLSLLSPQKAEDVNLEFQHEELYELYKKLEKIQKQLDDLR